jgi:methylmalonyl-CoA mutase N-terminal domain/subunit
VQAEVNRRAYEQEKRIRSGETRKVGVNCFVEDGEEPEVEFHPYREEEAEKQIGELQRIRRERDSDKVRSSLEGVRQAAAAGENVMPRVMDAVEGHATIGEICGVLKDVFGTYQEPVRF